MSKNKDPFNPNILFDQLKTIANAANQPLVDQHSREEIKVNFLPDNKVTPGKFKRSNLMPNTYYANPITLQAIRPDIFVLGEEGLEDFSQLYLCHACRHEFDLQFFTKCPGCLAAISSSSAD